MPCREFVDAYGQAWTVWSVAPSRAERRITVERRVARGPAGRELLGRGRERRAPDGSSAQRLLRLPVLPAMLRGWLVFESDREKRRLAPRPPGWERMSDRGLAELCARAMVVATCTGLRGGAPVAKTRPRCVTIAPRYVLAPRLVAAGAVRPRAGAPDGIGHDHHSED